MELDAPRSYVLHAVALSRDQWARLIMMNQMLLASGGADAITFRESGGVELARSRAELVSLLFQQPPCAERRAASFGGESILELRHRHGRTFLRRIVDMPPDVL